MSDYRKLSSEELRALTTINCCTNALRDMKQYIEKMCKREGMEQLLEDLEQAAHLAGSVARTLIEAAPDEDQRIMIIRRMKGLKLQLGYTRKHPPDVVTMDMRDANLLLAPLFDRCELECPCLDDAYDYKTQMQLVKMCEVRKALVRLGVAEDGLVPLCECQNDSKRRRPLLIYRDWIVCQNDDRCGVALEEFLRLIETTKANIKAKGEDPERFEERFTLRLSDQEGEAFYLGFQLDEKEVMGGE